MNRVLAVPRSNAPASFATAAMIGDPAVLSSARMADLLAHDISEETAREMQAARLADAKRELMWKIPLYAVGMAAFVVMYALGQERPMALFGAAATVTLWLGKELREFYRLCTMDPKQRLIEDELRPDD
jgi:hypothetical protein